MCEMRVIEYREAGGVVVLTEKINMLKVLCKSIQDDIYFLLISWKQYWPDDIVFPEQESVKEKQHIVDEILCAMEEIESEMLSQEPFGVFKQVTSHNYIGFIADGILCNTGWYIDLTKTGIVLNHKQGFRHGIHLMKNRYTKMGVVLLVFDWKFYMSDEMGFYEAEILFKEYSKGIV